MPTNLLCFFLCVSGTVIVGKFSELVAARRAEVVRLKANASHRAAEPSAR